MAPNKARNRNARTHNYISDYDTDTAANLTDMGHATTSSPLPPRTNEELNLSVLQRHDSSIHQILSVAPFAVVYLFNTTSSQWEKCGVEGTMFICSLLPPTSGPSIERYGVVVLNRRGLDNFQTELLTADDVEVTDEYVILQVTTEEGEEKIYGLWIFAEKGNSTEQMRMVNALIVQECAMRAENSRDAAAEEDEDEEEDYTEEPVSLMKQHQQQQQQELQQQQATQQAMEQRALQEQQQQHAMQQQLAHEQQQQAIQHHQNQQHQMLQQHQQAQYHMQPPPPQTMQPQSQIQQASLLDLLKGSSQPQHQHSQFPNQQHQQQSPYPPAAHPLASPFPSQSQNQYFPQQQQQPYQPQSMQQQMNPMQHQHMQSQQHQHQYHQQMNPPPGFGGPQGPPQQGQAPSQTDVLTNLFLNAKRGY